MATKLEKSFLELIERKQKKITTKKSIKMKDIGRKGDHFFECEAFTWLRQHNAQDKCFFFERLRRIELRGTKSNPLTKIGDVEYRISYYIVGKIGNKKDRWTFGQFCPTIPIEDFPKLINKAKADGVILDMPLEVETIPDGEQVFVDATEIKGAKNKKKKLSPASTN